MTIKVDLEKAYDHIEWDFLQMVLEEVEFREKLIKIIMFCVSSTKLSLLWNGDKLEPFTPNRGLRQGDRLSPYPFVLCMEVLGKRMNKAKAYGIWKGVKASRHGPSIPHIFFL